MTGDEPDWLDDLLRRALGPVDELPVTREELDAGFAAAVIAADLADPTQRAELDALIEPILATLPSEDQREDSAT